MKKLLILTFITAFCFTAKAQQDSVHIAEKVIESFKNNDIKALKKLIAPPKVYRLIYPEVKRKTNKQIINETANSSELKASFNKIIAKAKADGVTLDSLKYSKVEQTGPVIKTLRMLDVYYTIDGKEGYFGVFCHYINNNWYFSDFTNDDGVF